MKPKTVIWEDACNYANQSLDEVKEIEPELVETYGIVTMTRKYCIVMTHDSHGESNDYLRIPKSLVREIK